MLNHTIVAICSVVELGAVARHTVRVLLHLQDFRIYLCWLQRCSLFTKITLHLIPSTTKPFTPLCPFPYIFPLYVHRPGIKLLSLSQYSPLLSLLLNVFPCSTFLLRDILLNLLFPFIYTITTCSLLPLLPQSHAHHTQARPPLTVDALRTQSLSGIKVSYTLEEIPEYNQTVWRRKGGNPTNRATSRQTSNLSRGNFEYLQVWNTTAGKI